MWTRRSFFLSALGLPLLPTLPLVEAEQQWSRKLIRAARKQIGVTLGYDPSYVTLSYPGGDVPRESGVCTDVVIRAYRDALDVDLQVLVHDDMKANFAAYPTTWGLSRADKNIDHRRVPNLEKYFARMGYERATVDDPADWQAGDLMTIRLGGRLPHIAIFSGYDPLTGSATYIHNIGGGTREDGMFVEYTQPRHFRFPPPEAA